MTKWLITNCLDEDALDCVKLYSIQISSGSKNRVGIMTRNMISVAKFQQLFRGWRRVRMGLYPPPGIGFSKYMATYLGDMYRQAPSWLHQQE